jgi:homoserine kinase type II
MVPHPITGPIEADGAIYCATAFVPGSARHEESTDDQVARGRELARLHLSLRSLDLDQRPGWRCQHAAVTVHTDIDWASCVAALRLVDSGLANWATIAAHTTREELATLGAGSLPVLVIHGDFASWNVHYFDDGRLAGVIDFGLTHVDSRPYELAIARAYRAPAMVAAYRAELGALGWPLNELEEAAVEPMQRAFRVDMAAWFMDSGSSTGTFDVDMIRRQLQRTGTEPPT